MDKSVVITISREFGSGGRAIGEMVAKRLNIPFYDRKIIEMSAEKAGLAVSFVEDTEQKIKNKFLHSLAFGGYHKGADLGSMQLSLPDKLFIATCDIIRGIADEGSCVIVGRCADFVLKDKKNVLNVFVYSDDENKIKRVVKERGLSEERAESEVKKTNKYRSNHYEYYTERKWGEKSNYQLCLDSGFLGVEGAVDIIVSAAKKFSKGL